MTHLCICWENNRNKRSCYRLKFNGSIHISLVLVNLPAVLRSVLN